MTHFRRHTLRIKEIAWHISGDILLWIKEITWHISGDILLRINEITWHISGDILLRIKEITWHISRDILLRIKDITWHRHTLRIKIPMRKMQMMLMSVRTRLTIPKMAASVGIEHEYTNLYVLSGSGWHAGGDRLPWNKETQLTLRFVTPTEWFRYGCQNTEESN